MELYLPSSAGEWLAWVSALATVLLGLALLVAPRAALGVLKLKAIDPHGIAQARATIAGFHLGLGLAAILLAQPFVWLALAAGWAMTAFGRLVSILFDGGFTLFNLAALLLELVLMALPAAYALGYS
ncbi:MAG: AGROH133_08824 family phage infection protein [Pararhizobium sp.]